jgi:predicted Zn-dependent protease
VFDRRLTLSSDPSDPDGGYAPYFYGGFAQPRMTWVEDGILKNLAYDPDYAMLRGKAWAGLPTSFRMSGGPTTIDEMIGSCDEGIYVNRVSNVQLLNGWTGLVTGVTRDGCFLVKHGKMDRPVRNFRFMDSPWFFLNNILALGEPVRAAFGYTPGRDGAGWPRSPIIVPPMMVRDFNFTALANAI